MKQNFWNQTTFSALILSLITILYTLLNSVVELPKVLTFVLWFVKITATIGFMYYFIKDYAKGFETFSYGDGFKFAFFTSFFSALITSAYYFLHYYFIFPGEVEKISLIIEQAVAAQGDTGDMNNGFLNFMLNSFPHFMFITNLIYLTIFGTVISAILASFTKKENVFSE